MMNKIANVIGCIVVFLISVMLCSCTDGGQTAVSRGNSEIEYASLLTMERFDAYTLVTVSDPWSRDHGRVLHRYVLVNRDKSLPDSLPEGTVVRVPIDSALVYSSVHTGVLAELGSIDVVKGVADAQYFNDSIIESRLAAGSITDCGSSMSPTIEKVISMTPDAILLSPYQDATYGQITKLNVPIIECADYMETTPLGRAEWIKFYGELAGKREVADSVFNAVKENYNRIKNDVAQKGGERPKVLTESVISGIWNVPGGESYMSLLIQDAGGDYPWSADKHTGSLSLDINQVLAVAQDADVWLIKSMSIHTLADLKAGHALNDRFKAFRTGKVYICDTSKTHFFERFPFHPDMLLAEYAAIFRPSEFGTDGLQFYCPAK